MKTLRLAKTARYLAAGLVMGLLVIGDAGAASIPCRDPAVNNMVVSDAYVSACVNAGIGNINGNPKTDAFLLGGGAAAGYFGIGDGAFTQSGNSGTFSLAGSLWNAYADIAIGFKFGTGNQPDEWFIYTLQNGISTGNWAFVNVFQKGGGLSHIGLYSTTPRQVPEPGILFLLGLALLALGVTRRRVGRT